MQASYSVDVPSSSPAYTMQGRHWYDPRQDSPGPGKYSPLDQSHRRSPSFSMGSAVDRSATVGDKNSPGPVRLQEFRFLVQSVCVRSDFHLLLCFLFVCLCWLFQGAYLSLERPGGPAFTMGSRLDRDPRDVSPGPGQYSGDDRALHQSAPAYTIGTRVSLERQHVDDIPGPASYASGLPSNSPAFTMGARRPDSSRQDSPGPARYHVSLVNLPTAPAYTMGVRDHRTLDPGQDSPGPVECMRLLVVCLHA